MKSALIVAALMEHTAARNITVRCIKNLSHIIVALVMKEEWTGTKDQGQSLKLLGNLKENKMVTERTLKQWRKKALEELDLFDAELYDDVASGLAAAYQESLKHILCMTQELLDLHLIRK